MARLCRYCIVQLSALLALAWAAPALAQETGGLYERPVLVLDPGMHTAPIWYADIDAAGRYAVTGSYDKSVRVGSVEDGRLLSTIRLPAGPGHVGKVVAAAISPDGEVIAAGGWTRDPPQGEQIYLFHRATGEMVGRIEGLPNVVLHLTFSPDGRYLAATLGRDGLRVYDAAGWAEVARDADYADQSNGADFAPDGRLATTSYDNHVRLYGRSFNRVAKERTAGEQQPFGIALSPDGTKLAVGYNESTAVDLLDGRTLAPLSSPNTDGIYNGDLSKVAWSADGETLFAGGLYNLSGEEINAVVAWANAGAGARRALPAGKNTIMTLAPLPNGDLMVVAADPYLAVLGPDGNERWTQTPRQADFRYQEDTLAVSFDGQTVDFGYELFGKAPASFDVTTRSLQHDLPAHDKTAPPVNEGLPIQGWEDTGHPTLDGAPLPLDAYEGSRSLAIHPKGDRFVLGTDWSLRAYDAQGELLWRQAVPGTVWAVNISGDGRLVVAAYADGTIRWHRMDEGAARLLPARRPDELGRLDARWLLCRHTLAPTGCCAGT